MPTFDFPYILALSDHLSSSAQASKDAAKALRTEFKVRNQTLLPLSPLPTGRNLPSIVLSMEHLWHKNERSD